MTLFLLNKNKTKWVYKGCANSIILKFFETFRNNALTCDYSSIKQSKYTEKFMMMDKTKKNMDCEDLPGAASLPH